MIIVHCEDCGPEEIARGQRKGERGAAIAHRENRAFRAIPRHSGTQETKKSFVMCYVFY